MIRQKTTKFEDKPILLHFTVRSEIGKGKKVNFFLSFFHVSDDSEQLIGPQTGKRLVRDWLPLGPRLVTVRSEIGYR